MLACRNKAGFFMKPPKVFHRPLVILYRTRTRSVFHTMDGLLNAFCHIPETVMKITLEMPAAHYRWIDLLVCLPFLIVPLLIELPYRVNIFLSWEGAYRLYIGQMPFRDFGLPMGFGYWLLPSAFFHLFGPKMSTLVITQVFINFLSLISLRGILYNTGVKAYHVTLLLIVFCLTYVVYNFWPWYNHSVIVFEMAAIWLLTAYLARPDGGQRLLLVAGSAVLAFLSFFTKQDAGAICIMICMAMVVHEAVATRRYPALIVFPISLAIVAAALIIPFLPYDFLYWFNLGQAPHDSRVTIGKLLDVALGDAVWEKVYLAVIVLIAVYGGKDMMQRLAVDRPTLRMVFISVAMLGQAIITRATSPLPTDHMTYFHAFGIAGILGLSSLLDFKPQPRMVLVSVCLVVVLFSAGYWKYVAGILDLAPEKVNSEQSAVSLPWTGTSARGFEGVLMPGETVKGIERLLSTADSLGKPLCVLNMSELTPLALDMNYTPPTDQPLWYHLNIGIFDKEVDEFCRRVGENEYDVVLFEDIPDLTHFYPYRVRDTLRLHYTLVDSFLAPRKLENATIEVYLRK